MTCDDCRQLLLDIDWTREQRRTAVEALQHLEQCADCQAAMAQYEQIQDQMKPSGQVPTPMGGWDQFERRLLAAAAAEPKRMAWLPQAVKLAASFLLGMLVIEAVHGLLTRDAGRPPMTPGNPVALAPPTPPSSSSPPFTPQEVAQHAQAFDQVSRVFDGRASWVLLANNTSDVGIAPEPMTPQRKLLLLRLTMTHAGEQISSSDLVIIPGQSASLSVPLAQGQTLHYEIGTSPGDSTRLSLWAELQPAGGGARQAIGALATQLQLQPNQKVSAGEFATSSGAYQLKVGFSQTSLGEGKSPS